MLHQRIADDLKSAMKSGDDFQVGVLRLLLSSFHNKEIEKKSKGLEPDLSEEEIVEVLSKEAKKRREAVELYGKAEREDLTSRERKELEIIQKYLPAQLSEEEIGKSIRLAIERIGAKDIKDFGRAMAEAMKELKGRADAKTVSEIVKKNLNE